MPLPIRLYNDIGEYFDTIVDNTINGQEFIVSVPFAIYNVEFDPKNNIISRDNTVTLANESFNLDAAFIWITCTYFSSLVYSVLFYIF